jgi:hypothetical protein
LGRQIHVGKKKSLKISKGKLEAKEKEQKENYLQNITQKSKDRA